MLQPPPRRLDKLVLETRSISVSTLFRISRYASGEPYFGKAGTFRFDARGPKKARFGTCYCGFDLQTAIAETVLHDEIPVHGNFHLSLADFESRNVVRFAGKNLTLADLTGIPLKVLGGNGAISSITPYDLPQRWARAIHRHPQQVDGIVFVSRHLNDRLAVVIFDRASHKITGTRYSLLREYQGIASIKKEMHLTFPYP